MSFEPPRWPGGPDICEMENRPAFLTLASLDAFLHSLYPINGAPPRTKWRCGHCLGYHFSTNKSDAAKNRPIVPELWNNLKATAS